MTSPGAGHGILSFAIEGIDQAGLAQLRQHLKACLQSRPEFRVAVDELERGLLISAEDELQVTEIREELLGDNGALIGNVMVNYKETIRRPAEGEGKYIRQTGGSGNYGHCRLRIEPNERGRGYEFISEIKGDVIPKEYIKPIDQGIQGAMKPGILAGYPMVDVKVTLFDGSYHEGDSNEMAFKFAGSIAYKDAARKASPVLLEPVMAVEVTVPEEFMGMIIGDINMRRGRIVGIEHVPGSLVIKAIIPLAEALSSSAQGRPRYAMRYAGYEPVPSHGDFGNDAAGFAKKPAGPKPSAGSAAADLEP